MLDFSRGTKIKGSGGSRDRTEDLPFSSLIRERKTPDSTPGSGGISSRLFLFPSPLKL